MSTRGRPSASYAVAVLIACIIGTASSCPKRNGAGPAHALPASLIDAEGRPGSVLVQVEYGGSLNVPELGVDANQVRTDLATAMARGGSDQENLDDFLHELVSNPLRYITRLQEKISLNDKSGLSGSGLIVTPEGNVVTNAHVVGVDESSVAAALVASGYTGRVTTELSRIAAEQIPKFQLPEGVSKQIQASIAASQAALLDPSELTRRITIVMPKRDYEGKMVPIGLDCQVVVSGKRIPGKDVAVLKCDGNDDLPTVALAPSARSLARGEDLFVLGYPGAATYHPALSENSITEASLTMGHVSALKSMAEGWTVIQTDAAVTHGNSGGPVFESDGRVIGIVTFGSVDRAGAEVAGFNYVIPIDVVNEFLLAAHVIPKISNFSSKLNEASAAYQAGDYTRAKRILSGMKENELGGHYVTSLRERMDVNSPSPKTTETASHDTAGSETASGPAQRKTFKGPSPIAVLGGVGLALVIFISIVASNKRHRHR